MALLLQGQSMLSIRSWAIFRPARGQAKPTYTGLYHLCMQRLGCGCRPEGMLSLPGRRARNFIRGGMSGAHGQLRQLGAGGYGPPRRNLWSRTDLAWKPDQDIDRCRRARSTTGGWWAGGLDSGAATGGAPVIPEFCIRTSVRPGRSPAHIGQGCSLPPKGAFLLPFRIR